jgi:hypothetical protein
MNKTLHKKLTEKHLYKHTPTLAYYNGDDMQPGTGFANEMSMLREAAKDLMQPRKEAIANILRLAATI